VITDTNQKDKKEVKEKHSSGLIRD